MTPAMVTTTAPPAQKAEGPPPNPNPVTAEGLMQMLSDMSRKIDGALSTLEQHGTSIQALMAASKQGMVPAEPEPAPAAPDAAQKGFDTLTGSTSGAAPNQPKGPGKKMPANATTPGITGDVSGKAAVLPSGKAADDEGYEEEEHNPPPRKQPSVKGLPEDAIIISRKDLVEIFSEVVRSKSAENVLAYPAGAMPPVDTPTPAIPQGRGPAGLPSREARQISIGAVARDAWKQRHPARAGYTLTPKKEVE